MNSLAALSPFKIDAGLGFLTLGILTLDIFLPDDEKRGRTLTHMAMAGVAALLVLLLTQWKHFGSAFGGSLIQDGLAFYFKMLFLLAAFLVLSMAGEYQTKLKRGHSEFPLLILTSLVGMSVVASANDLILFFVSLETLSVSLYIMTAYLRDQETSIEAGVKYLVLGALATSVFVYGLSFLYGATGSTRYAEIHEKLLAMPGVPASFTFGMILVIAALAFKIAAVPFHLWVPDVYEGAPTPVTAYLAIGSKAAGFAALLRLVLSVFSPALENLETLFAVLAALTILYGNLGAIPQTNLKRLLGYSSIGHAGYLLIGLAAVRHEGAQALAFYLLTYLFSTGGTFLVLALLTRELKTDEISELRGLSRRSPILAATMFASLLSLAGVPPLAGFFGKFYLLFAGVKAGLLWLVFIGALNVITSLYYYLKIVKAMYIDKPAGAVLALSPAQKILPYLCMFAILLLGVWQGPFVRLVQAVFKYY